MQACEDLKQIQLHADGRIGDHCKQCSWQKQSMNSTACVPAWCSEVWGILALSQRST